MHLCIFGNPIDGFRHVGPFVEAADAIEYGEQTGGGDWWIATIDQPEPMKGGAEQITKDSALLHKFSDRLQRRNSE